VETYRAALPLAPATDTSVYNNIGSTLLVLDRFEEAEDAFTRALQRRRSPSALSNLGTVKFYLQRWSEAADLYREALRGRPNDYRLLGNYADSLAMTGAPKADVLANYRRAAEESEKFLAVRTDAIDTAADLAWYLLNSGETARARALIESVSGAHEISGDIAYRLALCHATLGEADAARRWRDAALQRGYSTRIIAATPLLSKLAER
jgi:tetratricopeptide (TPR) repeat protein